MKKIESKNPAFNQKILALYDMFIQDGSDRYIDFNGKITFISLTDVHKFLLRKRILPHV